MGGDRGAPPAPSQHRVTGRDASTDCAVQSGEHSAGPSSQNNEDDHLKESDIINVIIAFVLRHNLSKAAVSDLLDMLRLLGVTRDIPASKYMLLKSILEDIDGQKCIHFYCAKCVSYVDGCESMCGACEHRFSKEDAMKDGNFFMYIPIHDQLKGLLESGCIGENLVNCDRETGVLSDTVDGNMYHRYNDDLSLSLQKLTVSWNLDGLPIFKSSGASLWPILLQINELKPSVRRDHMLMCGLWFGPKKPLWATYSKPFVNELAQLSTVGISWNDQGNEEANRVTRVGSHAIVCDAPARCMVQGTNQFNGAFGCTWCLQEGSVVPKGNGVCRIYSYQPDAPKRTHANVTESIKAVVELNKTHHNGVKTASPLLVLPDRCGVDIVRSFAVDYMHAVLLGVVRMFLELWFGAKWNSASFSIRGSQARVDERLSSIRPPQDISRTPRSLSDAKQWKASECRNWLLFYSVPLLFGTMRTKFWEHWCLLVGAIFTLLQDRIPVSSISAAENSLRSFVQATQTLYGEEHMSSNVHALLHLGDCVRDFGPLWACSAFPYEGFMMKIKRMFSGTTHLSQQLANNFLLLQTLKRGIAAPDSDARVSAMVSQWLGVYSPCEKALASNEGAVGLGAGRVKNMEPRAIRVMRAHGYNVPETANAHYFDRVVISGSICCTEGYGKGHKRNSYTLFTRYGIGRVDSICFLGGTDGKECFIFMHRSDFVDVGIPVNHMRSVVSTNSLMMCRPSDIECNAVVVEVEKNGRPITVCAKQPNKIEKD